MEENTTPAVVHGQHRLHPALRRLARACIALARARRDVPPAEASTAASQALASSAQPEQKA